LWRKFGIAPELLPDFLKEAGRCPHIELKGLQFHTSWNLTPQAQTDFIAVLGGTLAALPAPARAAIDFIDVGGGYWPERGEWLQNMPAGEGAATEAPLVHYRLTAVSIRTFAEQLHTAIHEHLKPVLPCRICFEPGRWICNDAMHLVMSVIDKKAPDLVITNCGINAVGWDRFETDYFPVLNLSRPSLHEKPCNLLGSLCTPHDVFGRAYFGTGILPGDILMIPCQGAYTYSLSQHFIKPVPCVVAV
jgi:diaminopimelate decarboxylase